MKGSVFGEEGGKEGGGRRTVKLTVSNAQWEEERGKGRAYWRWFRSPLVGAHST